MTLGARCAAEPPEGLFICPGRTCGFAAEISSALPTRSLGELPIDLEEDPARAVCWGLIARDAL
jgi:hypothetical protein